MAMGGARAPADRDAPPPWTAVAGGVLILIGIYVAITGQARAQRAGDEPVPVAVPVE